MIYETMPIWAVIVLASIFAATVLLLTMFYMPRTSEILKYKKRIKELRQKLDEISKNATAATLEHTADIGEISEKLLAAEGKTETIRAEAGEKVAQANARTEQQKQLAEKFAKLCEDLKRSRRIQGERN